MSDIKHDKVLILDFGSQYTQLIARCVRELGVYCEIYAAEAKDADIVKFAPKGIILSGGPQSVTAKNALSAPKIVFELGCPILGICYGMQTMAKELGGKVIRSQKKEFGHAHLQIRGSSSVLFEALPASISKIDGHNVWMSHGDKVAKLPDGFKVIGSTDNTTYAAMEHSQKKLFGLQFHPEVTHTKCGKRILSNFVHKICGCKKLWTTRNIINSAVKKIKATVGEDKVLLGLSGGVDSAVAALLLQQAIGDNLVCVFVDTGLLRLNEAEQVKEIFSQHFHLNIICVNARKRFLTALKNVGDPEAKRKIIGKEFIHTFQETIQNAHTINWLAQGTIYPDVIESAQTESGKTATIKSHHNVGGLPEKMHLKLIEPLRELFKDEVRKVGLKLGLPREVVYRHPFPGPGLGVRIMGEVKKQYVSTLQLADHIFLEELRNANLYHKVSQAFAVFLPVNSVGVMGDERKFEPVIALRAVKSIDFMTAQWARLPQDFLSKVSNRIVNEVHGISRVVYDITGKPPATIEWE